MSFKLCVEKIVVGFVDPRCPTLVAMQCELLEVNVPPSCNICINEGVYVALLP